MPLQPAKKAATRQFHLPQLIILQHLDAYLAAVARRTWQALTQTLLSQTNWCMVRRPIYKSQYIASADKCRMVT